MVTFHWPLTLPWAVGPDRSIVKMMVSETASHVSDSVEGLSESLWVPLGMWRLGKSLSIMLWPICPGMSEGLYRIWSISVWSINAFYCHILFVYYLPLLSCSAFFICSHYFWLKSDLSAKESLLFAFCFSFLGT